MHKKLPSLFFSLALFIGLIFFGLTPVQSNAQGMSSFYFQAGIPMNQFSANLDDDAAFGFNFQHLRQLGQSPFSLGAGINIMGYGGDRWNEYWAIGESVYDADYAIENCIMDFEGRFRFQPRVPVPVMPYGEVFAGISSMSTTFSVSDENLDDCNNTLYEEVLNRDLAPVYGAGFGLMIPICGDEMFVDIGATYRNSGSMSYMNDDFDRVFTSRTDMWLIRFGITMRTF